MILISHVKEQNLRKRTKQMQHLGITWARAWIGIMNGVYVIQNLINCTTVQKVAKIW